VRAPLSKGTARAEHSAKLRDPSRAGFNLGIAIDDVISAVSATSRLNLVRCGCGEMRDGEHSLPKAKRATKNVAMDSKRRNASKGQHDGVEVRQLKASHRE